jgi:beta-galactosidase
MFSSLVGKAQVWIDGKLVGEKDDPKRSNLSVHLPPGEHERTVAVVIEATPGSRAGFGGEVVVK